MSHIGKTHRTVLTSFGGVALVAALAACSAGAPDADGSAPAVPTGAVDGETSGTAAPTQTPSWDPAVTAAWAAEAVPTAGSTGFILAQNGHVEAGQPEAFTLQASSLVAGAYSLHFACRGDADTTVSLSDDAGATLSTSCTDEASGMDISTQQEGVTLNVTGGNGAAVDWALAITEPLPR
jgi:hypothetical protein